MKKSDNLYEFASYSAPEPRILPIITKPFPDELFSSWILRCSHRHELKPYVFAKFVWGAIAIWNRDIDKSIKRSSLEIICQLNRVSYKTGFQTTLKSYEGILFDQLNETGVQDLITTAGIYHRKRKQKSLMYCPICLKKELYFRKLWRVSIICCCTNCKIYLRDKCPHCSEAIMPFRLNIEKRKLFNDFQLNTCWKCKLDLTDTPGVPASQEIIMMTKRIEKQLRSIHVPLAPLFSRLRFLKRVLVSNRKLIFHLQALNVCNIPTQAKPQRNSLFEVLNVEERAEILKGAAYLLHAWPSRFRRFVSYSNINYSELVQERRHKDFYPVDLQSVLKSKTT